MKILIRTITDSIGYQIIDAWHAYIQHVNQYNNTTEYILKDSTDKSPDNDCDLSILLSYMGHQVTDETTKHYDIVLICNGSEPLAVANPQIKQLLTNDNVYLIANSYLMDHELQSKVIWFPVNFTMCRDYWTRHFYPQFYDVAEFEKLPRTNNISVITGANRANRSHFFSELYSAVPQLTDSSKFGQPIEKLVDSQWETSEDQAYRIYVNGLYHPPTKYHNEYYDNLITIGIDNKFGEIPPGYFQLPLYYENSCVIFPEASWQNNELSVTEKSIKCFYAGSVPFPIGGANINYLYNKIGFYTAWNLLPEELKRFDSMTNHVERVHACIKAIKWLANHPEVFDTPEFVYYTQQNKINALTCRCDNLAVEKFDQLIKKYVK